MRRNFLIWFATATLSAVSSAPAPGEEPFTDLTYAEALKAAAQDNKIVLLDFYTTWCGPCKKLDQTTWNDKKVAKWLAQKAIALKIDAEKEKKLAEKFRIGAYPTIVLLKPDETEIDRLVGYRDAETFLSEANDALAGKDSLTRAKEQIEGDKENDPLARMEYARTLIQKGRHEEGLKELLWCFDHGAEYSPAFSGVRLSFLLNDIASLGRQYPKALEALQERRGRAEKAIRQAKHGKDSRLGGLMKDDVFEAVTTVQAINRALDEKELTLALFDELGEQETRATRYRRFLLRDILDLLIEDRRYEDIVDCTDVLQEVNNQIEMYQDIVKRFADEPHSPANYMKERTLEEGGMYYEAALGAKRFKLGEEIARKLIALDKTGETYGLLIKHTRRAKAHTKIRKLVKQAEKDLAGEEMRLVRRAVEQAPSPEEP